MKLLRILISFALANVLVAELDEYDKQVIVANEYIKSAGAQLTTVIKNIVLGKFTMVEMALMLAVPETEEDVRIEHKMIDYQHIMQNQVWYVTGAVIPNINEDDFKDVQLPELGKSRRFYTKAAVKALIRVALRHHLECGFRRFSPDVSFSRIVQKYKIPRFSYKIC
ncbi:uncharacterized protein LOC126847681 isoform X2 [Adelges cooleyi]|uniref:uncharacterized protein LOC126847681 isoform X2 n=1 Tax=Adelges cooleyi TaxID=133065 RepID=UPI00217F4153|nr:uncharacterized protein LOC126847681 isoform X2 [Adelges cooleyi]